MGLLDKMQMEDLDEEQCTLVELTGIGAFRILVRNYNSTPIHIPRIKSLGRPARDKLIREELDGKGYHELALKYGLTEAWIRNMAIEKAHEVRTRPMGDQISLEGILY